MSNIIASNQIKSKASSYNYILVNQVLQISKCSFKNAIFKKLESTLKVLAGIFLLPGSGLATPGLECYWLTDIKSSEDSVNSRISHL